VSCIDVTIMDRSAHSALPSPYSKIFPAFGAGAAVTHACVSAFILQHGSKCAPARIEHRLGVSGLCERTGIHVADEHSPVGLDQAGTQLMQEIFSSIRDLGVNRATSLSMAGALCAGQDRFQVAVKALGLDRRQSLITECGKRAQPQIDSHTRHRAIEDRTDGQPPSREVNLSGSIANNSDLEGNPAQRPACTAALAPGEQDPNVPGRSRAGHPYSVPKSPQNKVKAALNTQKRLPLSLAGLKAGVSRGEQG
jgi:hypothetical protein